MKILILKPSSLGDVIQALPVLRLLKRHLPAAEIFWWIDSNLAPLLEGDPDLAGVVRFERRRWAAPRHWPEMLRSIRWMREQKFWWIDSNLAPLFEGDPDLAGVVRFERRRWAAPRHWPEMLRSIRWMRAQNFDWVIDLQCLARSAAFAWLANGKFLIGLDEVREGARGFYDVAVRRPSFHTHAVDWYLAVLPRLDVPVHTNFQWLPERPAAAAEVKRKWLAEPSVGVQASACPDGTLKRELQPQGARWIALQPGARWSNKRWPAEHFAELVRLLAEKFSEARFAILGVAGDKPLGEIISRAAPTRCLDLCGETSLPEMVEWLRRCELMVTNDTGPMHAAAALGKPMVALFGPTEPRRTGPYGQLESVLRLDLPCSPCMKSHCVYEKPNECLKALTPAMVFERVQKQLLSTAG